MRAKEILGVIECDSSELRGSYESALKINKIGGVCVQGENPTPSKPQEVKKSVVSEIRTCGKNLLNVNTCIYGNINASGQYTTNMTNMVSDYIKSNGEICVSTNANIAGIGIAFYDSNKTYLNRAVATNTNHSLSQKVDGCEYVRVWFGISDITTETLATYEPMLNEGTKALPYEPYIESVVTFSEPITLHGIGDVMDEIDVERGKVKRKFASVVFNGSENWKKSSTYNNRYYLQAVSNGVGYGAGMCTQFTVVQNDTKELNTAHFSSDVIGRFVVNAEFATLEEWKAHLQTNPLTVVYELAEEVIEDLPLTDQIALNSLKTFHGFTHVEFAGDVQPTLNSDYATNLVGAVALAVHAYNEIEKRFVTFNAEDGSANFSGNIVNNAYIVGNNLQANQMVFAQAVQASIQLISKGSITADTNIEAKGNITAVNTIEAKGDLKGKDLYITNIGIGDGAPQPVEWVWDNVLARWVLCSIPLE